MSAAYSSTFYQLAGLPGSASLRNNNLSVNAGNVCFSHVSDAYILPERFIEELIGRAENPLLSPLNSKFTSEGSRIPAKDVRNLQQVKICSFELASFVVLATSNCIQIWSGSGDSLLLNFPLPAGSNRQGSSNTPNGGSGAPERPPAAQGICSVRGADGSQLVCVGSFSGDIFSFEAKGAKVMHTGTRQCHTQPITDVGSAHDSSRGAADESLDLLASADHEGTICVWQVASSTNLTSRLCVRGEGIPCTALTIRRDILLCSFSSGLIRIYNHRSESLCVEIEAHSRFLSALALHPIRDIFATVAEDGSINVWSLPDKDGKVSMIMTAICSTAMLTGVAFLGMDAKYLAASAYDMCDLFVWLPGQ